MSNKLKVLTVIFYCIVKLIIEIDGERGRDKLIDRKTGLPELMTKKRMGRLLLHLMIYEYSPPRTFHRVFLLALYRIICL